MRQSSSTVGTGVAVGQTKTSSEQSSKMTCAWEAAWFPQSSTAFHVRTMLTDCVHEATSQLEVGLPRVDGEVPWLQNTLASAGTVKVFAPSIPKLTLKSEVDDRVTVWLLPGTLAVDSGQRHL